MATTKNHEQWVQNEQEHDPVVILIFATASVECPIQALGISSAALTGTFHQSHFHQ
jgi:hypothetical protein